MLSPFRTLRFRLTMLYVVIFGLIQAVLWVTVDAARTSYLRRQLDYFLLERAEQTAGLLAGVTRGEDNDDWETVARQALERSEGQTVYVQISRADGTVVARSRNLAGRRLPLPRGSAADSQPFKTIPALAGQPAEGRLRLVSVRRPLAGSADQVLVQVASGLAPLEGLISGSRRMLATFGLVSLLVAGITSWLLARRSLAPISRITEQARALSASRLDQRIPLPAAHDEVAELALVINQMLERLETDFHNQQRFMSDVSHELRTPIAVLLGEAQARLREVERSGASDPLALTVQDESRRMLRTVESFMTLTRAQAGNLPVARQELSMEDVLVAGSRKAQRAARARGVKIISRLEAKEEPRVIGDMELLASMIDNLLQNAIRHSPRGQAVELGLRAADGIIELTVRDRGRGIPEPELERIFEPFYRVPSHGNDGDDVGLGLTVVRAVAALHGGTVIAGNRTGGGAEFIVRLPTVPAQAASTTGENAITDA